MFNQLLELSEADRLDARQIARDNVIRRYGQRPTRANYADHADRAYPRYIVRTVTALILVVLAAFFALSAMRLYTIGSTTFADRISDRPAVMIAGVAVVVGSESGALVFALAAGVLAKTRRERRLLWGLAFASTAIALVGNVQFALGGGWRSMLLSDPFAVIEAVLPPVVVLGGALVIERLWLDDVARHHANETAYKQALAEWQALTADPEASPHWRQAYATALRDKLRDVNGSGRGKTEREAIMSQLTTADWRALVWHELQADQWWHEPDAPQDAHHEPATADGGNHARPLADTPALAGMGSPNGNGHRNGNH